MLAETVAELRAERASLRFADPREIPFIRARMAELRDLISAKGGDR